MQRVDLCEMSPFGPSRRFANSWRSSAPRGIAPLFAHRAANGRSRVISVSAERWGRGSLLTLIEHPAFQLLGPRCGREGRRTSHFMPTRKSAFACACHVVCTSRADFASSRHGLGASVPLAPDTWKNDDTQRDAFRQLPPRGRTEIQRSASALSRGPGATVMQTVVLSGRSQAQSGGTAARSSSTAIAFANLCRSPVVHCPRTRAAVTAQYKFRLVGTLLALNSSFLRPQS